MKAFGFWVLFLFVGPALICLSFSTSGMAFTRHENDATMATSSRKLKQNSHTKVSDKSDATNINLEDYAPIDPVPSSMTSIRPGPIQHGTPLMPYIPKPSPPGPDHPKHDGLP